MTLACEQVDLRLGGRSVLEGVSLVANAGELHAVLGPNGAGKSSLLRLFSGELAPSAGVVCLNHTSLRRWDAANLARQRAVLPQSESLRFAFRVREVVALGRLPCRGNGAARESAIVEEAMAATDVAHLAEREYPTLSGGERQRVQLARVLAQVWEPLDTGPRWLLLDEPTAALDLSHQHGFLRRARAFAARGAGVVAVLHDPNLALAYADRVTLLVAGRVLATGAPAEVLTPANVERAFGVRVRTLDVDGRLQLAVIT